MRSLFRRSQPVLFEPRMPEVDESSTLAQVFDQARTAAVGADQADGAAARSVVIVTPGRLLRLQPCPPPGTMPEQQVL
jgi:hypothetical protein